MLMDLLLIDKLIIMFTTISIINLDKKFINPIIYKQKDKKSIPIINKHKELENNIHINQ